MRHFSIHRRTQETSVEASLCIEGEGRGDISTGIGFLDHMLGQLARHSGMDIRVHASGDLHIDGHHTTEDTGIALGQALSGALGERRGIVRYGSALIPMDEALARVVLDLSCRPWLSWHVPMGAPRLGEMDTELFREWFRAFAWHGGITLHVTSLCGENSHHIIESCFKALARALRQAAAIDPSAPGGGVPSTKGLLREGPSGGDTAGGDTAGDDASGGRPA